VSEADFEFDPFAPSFVRDPYATYRALRDRPKAAWSTMEQGWLITRYDDVHTVLHDPHRFSSSDRDALSPWDDSRPLRGLEILGRDPPDHTRLRKAIVGSFTQARVAALRPKIEALVDGLLDRGLQRGRIELMEQLAVPLPLMLTAQMLGVDTSMLDRLRAWSDSEMTKIQQLTTPEEKARLIEHSQEMLDYFRGQIGRARSRETRDDNLFGRLLHAADDNAQLSSEELLAFLALMIRAGSHTITHMIGNAVLALVRRRTQVDALRAQPQLWKTAVDELARHSGPLHSVVRIVRERVTLHGVALEPGERLLVVLASANRDERKFADPDELLLDREPGHHFGFGSGIHYCVGAQLGKLQAQIAIGRMLERMPLIARMEVLREPEWALTWAFRGLRRLPLRGGADSPRATAG
jgi:cytochrome P450